MRRTAATGAAAVGVGAGAHHAGVSPIGPASAQSISDATTVIGLAAGGPAYLAYDFLANDGENTLDLLLGDNAIYSGYQDPDILHQDLVAAALRMKSADERVMTSIQNNITNAENIALSKGKAAAIEAMNAEKSQSEAQTAMQSAIDEYYSTIQNNIIIHYGEQTSQILHQMDSVADHPDATVGIEDGVGIWNGRRWLNDGWVACSTHEYQEETLSITLLDGSSVDYTSVALADTTSSEVNVGDLSATGDNTKIRLTVVDPDGSDDVEYHDTFQYYDALQQVTTSRDQVNSDLSGFIGDVYAEWDVGEIPTEDLIDPITAATELGQDYDHTAMRSAQAAMLGIPMQDARTITLEVHTDGDTSTEGTIVTATIFTEHVPTDGDGNEGFTTGTVYEPSTWSEPLYVAYDWSDTNEDGVITDEERDFVQLESPFEINQIISTDGEEVQSFKTKDTNNQTADVSKLREEINQLNDTIAEMRERQQEEATGGGGGWIRQNPLATALGGLAAIALIFGAGSTQG
jgi:ElaB/YqjD/DUF883 family membrane-anchored ribosome-binding protein